MDVSASERWQYVSSEHLQHNSDLWAEVDVVLSPPQNSTLLVLLSFRFSETIAVQHRH